METDKKIFRFWLVIAAGSLVIGLAFFIFTIFTFDNKLHVWFCDVGQGDAIFIRTPQRHDVLVDGGPDNRVLGCLSRAMPFWDRTIELMVLTHPQADHLTGLVEVLRRYRVQKILTTNAGADTAIFRSWKNELEQEHAQGAGIYFPQKDQVIGLGAVKMAVGWPDDGNSFDHFAGDLNETAIVTKLIYGDFCLWLTSDVPYHILERAITGSCGVLKVAHHGSKTGTSPTLLDMTRPQLAVILVGAKNSYGHPAGEILQLLADKQIKILRTDLAGEIEVVSDGKGWRVEVSH